jgi:hypothetical protein
MTELQPWMAWEGQGEPLPFSVQVLTRLQREAARERAEEQREQAERERRVEERQDKAIATAMARAQLRGEQVDPRNPATYARTPAEVLAEAAELAAAQDARERAREWLSSGDVEIIGPVFDQAPKVEPAKPATPASRSAVVRAKARRIIQRAVTGTDEGRIAELAAEVRR